jgi:hypothetical protein
MRPVLFGAGVLLLVVKSAFVLVGCKPLTAADRQALAFDAVRIEVCQQKGRDCKRFDRDAGADCFGVYDDCIIDAGLRQ